MPQIESAYYDLLDYGEALKMQRERVERVDREAIAGAFMLLQHPPTFTLGTNGHLEHLLWDKQKLDKKGIRVYRTDRGGDITYHGPGQLVGYPILYIPPEKLDLHGYLRQLEQVIIDTLLEYGIKGERKGPYTGVWIADAKIAAIGVKFHKCKERKGFVTSHGFSLNVASDLSGFDGIIPCGIREYGVTSMERCGGKKISVRDVAQTLSRHFSRIFDCTLVWV